MATTEDNDPAAPETAPEPEDEGAAKAPAGRSVGPLSQPASWKLFSRDRLSGRAPKAALGLVLVLSLVVLALASGTWPGAGSPSHEPASPSPAPIAAATASPTSAPTPTTAPTPSPYSTPAESPSSAMTDPAPPPLSATLKPQPGRAFEHGDTSRAVVYITIDDCRNWANVEKDLQAANAAGVQVTLFPAGKYVDADKAGAARVLQEAVAYGDEIGNHTYTHWLLTGGTMIDIKADLDAQIAVVRTALNDKTYREWFVRPPYGSGLGNPGFVNAAVKDGLSIAMWSDDSKGYQSGSTVPFVLQNVFVPKHFQNGAIILLHDDDTDTAAFPLILDGIRTRGFSVGGALKNILGPGASAAANIGLPAGPASFPDAVARAESPLRQLGLRRWD
jgi:peptidoglycan/xylan/chitin deacetylase (PgdA/CDA1 family)